MRLIKEFQFTRVSFSISLRSYVFSSGTVAQPAFALSSPKPKKGAE